MSVFARITELPPIGTRESPQLELKASMPRVKSTGKPDYFEIAKDVASMASAYGGVILVGACEDGTTKALARFNAMSEEDTGEIIEAFQLGVRDKCVPPPLIDAARLACDGGYVVAVHVYPNLDRPVAVRVTAEAGQKFGSDAYVFPVRLSTHAIPLSPEHLPMLMNPAIRRIAILLEGIPKRNEQVLSVHWEGFRHSHAVAPPVSVSRFVWDPMALAEPAVQIESNSLRLLWADKQSDSVRIPLDDVETVWEGSDGKWCVRVSGYFESHDYRTRCRGNDRR